MEDFTKKRKKNMTLGSKTSGTVYGNVSNASTIYGEDKFNTPRGHGFAAERANTLYDKITGHDARIVGDDNVKNGADRICDGISIQSKYCKTGGKCISECFEEGKFRYMNADGTPMQIEVPSDMYDSALQSMQERIRRNEVPGVTDPEEAKNIVRRGKFTYAQVKNIAKAGTIESITYDAVNGSIIATNAFGVTAVVSFATSIWNGDDTEIALKKATAEGLKVGGTTFITAVLAGQITKAGLNSALTGSTEGLITILGPKGSAVLVNAFRGGKNIYGAAAMKNAAKMLRSNVITGVASIVVLSVGDVANIFRGRISTGQLLKNLANTTSSVAGGTAGWIGGAYVGASIGSVVPIIGTTVGGIVGGLAGAFGGGLLGGKASDKVLNNFIEDDADEMLRILEKVFSEIAVNYLLSQQEVEDVIDYIGDNISGKELQYMYASNDREYYAEMLLLPFVETKVASRKKIGNLSREKMQYGLKQLLEEIADNEGCAVV